MLLGVSPHFVKLDLLFMVAAVEELIKLLLAAPYLKHSILFAAVFECLSCLPAFATSDLVCFHLQTILLDSTENIETPIVPHWWTCPNDIVRLRHQFGHLLHRVELFPSNFGLLLFPCFIFLLEIVILIVLGLKFMAILIRVTLLLTLCLWFTHY